MGRGGKLPFILSSVVHCDVRADIRTRDLQLSRTADGSTVALGRLHRATLNKQHAIT